MSRDARWSIAVEAFELNRARYERWHSNYALATFAWNNMEYWRKGFERHLTMPERKHNT